ncbi:MAG TPA: hypothetical protein VJ302_13960 [Blastocatellia bacterium]|nr:hypothetical protein [Blastocatellia bacterium]
MSNRRFASHGLRSLPVYHSCFILIALLLILVSISCNGAVQSEQIIKRNLDAFFEAFLGRELSQDEIREITDEFIRIHTAKGQDRPAIVEISRQFEGYVKILREQKDTPTEIGLRHQLLETSYFQPQMQNTIELRLLTAPDPVRVVDPGGKGLMTQRDVVALANLSYFANSDEAPSHHDLSRQTIDELVARLDRAFGDQRGADRLRPFFKEAAELWAGIQQRWPELNDAERRQARAYAGKAYQAPMETKMYAKLLDLNPNAAFSHWNDDLVAARLRLASMEPFLSAFQNAIRGGLQ